MSCNCCPPVIVSNGGGTPTPPADLCVSPGSEGVLAVDGDGCLGLTLDTSGPLQPGPDGLTVCVSPEDGNALTTDADGCLLVATDSSGPLQPGPDGLTVCVSDDPGNALTTDADGCLLVATDSSGPLQPGPDGLTVCVSAQPDNALTKDADGCLYVAPGGAADLCVSPGSEGVLAVDGDGCLGLTLDTSGPLQPGPDGLTVCVSPEDDNALTTDADGCLLVATDSSGPIRPGDDGLTLCLSEDPDNAAVLDPDGCLLVPAAAAGALPVVTMSTQVVTFEESGTFTPADYPGLQYVRVRAVAGGGGAAGIFASPAGEVHLGQAGGGGTYAESLITAADIPASVPVTVGAGGVGVPAEAASTLRAGIGDPSSFGSLVIAANGSTTLGAFTGIGQRGSSQELYRPGAPRTRGGSVGQVIVNGEQGGAGIAFGPDALGPERLLIGLAYGGRSFLSPRSSGGDATWNYAGGAISPPTGPNGSGWGAGAPAPHSGTGQANDAITGGNGTAGVVIVEVYQLQVTAA